VVWYEGPTHSPIKDGALPPLYITKINQMKGVPGYDTTGKSHHEGKENEHNTAKILNEKKAYPFEVVVLGGNRKQDAISGSQHLSMKRMKNTNSGTHDWANLSSVVTDGLLGNVFDEFLDQIKELRQLPKSIREDIEFQSLVEQKFNALRTASFDYLTSENIIKVLNKGLIDACFDFHIAVNDIAKKKIFIYDANRHPVFEYVKKGFTAYLEGDAPLSRMIYFEDFNGNHYPTDIRLRVTNNNGTRAFLGVSEANTNSSVVIKLQQDRVGNLLKSVNPREITY